MPLVIHEKLPRPSTQLPRPHRILYPNISKQNFHFIFAINFSKTIIIYLNKKIDRNTSVLKIEIKRKLGHFIAHTQIIHTYSLTEPKCCGFPLRLFEGGIKVELTQQAS